MHGRWSGEHARARNAEMLAEAEGRRLARLAVGARPTLRARTARLFFGFALALEREETWRAAWERLEGPGRP